MFWAIQVFAPFVFVDDDELVLAVFIGSSLDVALCQYGDVFTGDFYLFGNCYAGRMEIHAVLDSCLYRRWNCLARPSLLFSHRHGSHSFWRIV